MLDIFGQSAKFHLPDARQVKVDLVVSGVTQQEVDNISSIQGVEWSEYVPDVRALNLRFTPEFLKNLLSKRPQLPPKNTQKPPDFALKYTQFRAKRYADAPCPSPFSKSLAVSILLADCSAILPAFLRWHESILSERAQHTGQNGTKKDGFFIEKDAIQAGESCAILARATADILGEAIRLRGLNPLT